MVRFFQLPMAAATLALILSGCSSAPEQQAVRRADQLLADNDLRGAAAVLEQALTTWPQSAELRRREIFVLLKADQPDRAFEKWQAQSADDSVLRLALRHHDPVIRAGAARLIAEHHTPLPSRELVRALSDSAAAVRRYCARELGRRGEAMSLRPLFQLLRDDHWQVRAEAVAGLTRLGNPRATGWLLYLLGDPDDFVRYQAELGLIALAHDSNRGIMRKFLPRLSPAQRLVVAAALATLAEPDAVELLRNAAVSEEVTLRARAAELIGRAQVRVLANELARLRDDPDPQVRIQAKRAWEMWEGQRPPWRESGTNLPAPADAPF